VFGEKEFNLVVTPIHPPPLGDIKVLSSLLTQPLKQFIQGLVLELAMEVCFHVPNAPPALNIWTQWSSVSLCAALFHVIDCLQNTFVPIVYHTHIL
jgi:hypothetical protein